MWGQNEEGNGKRGGRHEQEGQRGWGKKVFCWWRMCLSTGIPMGGKVPIMFSTYNIRNSRNGELDSVLRGVSQSNMDLGIFQETKVINGIYTRGLSGCIVIATDTLSRHRGGVAVFHRPAPHFAVEIEFPRHQQFCSPGAFLERGDDTLYR